MPDHGVVILGSITALIAMGASLGPVSSSKPGPDTRHPVAALAWAQANCVRDLALNPRTPRIQAEDLLATSAAFDAERSWRSDRDICADAIALAEPVTTTATRLARVPGTRDR